MSTAPVTRAALRQHGIGNVEVPGADALVQGGDVGEQVLPSAGDDHLVAVAVPGTEADEKLQLLAVVGQEQPAT